MTDDDRHRWRRTALWSAVAAGLLAAGMAVAAPRLTDRPTLTAGEGGEPGDPGTAFFPLLGDLGFDDPVVFAQMSTPDAQAVPEASVLTLVRREGTRIDDVVTVIASAPLDDPGTPTPAAGVDLDRPVRLTGPPGLDEMAVWVSGDAATADIETVRSYLEGSAVVEQVDYEAPSAATLSSHLFRVRTTLDDPDRLGALGREIDAFAGVDIVHANDGSEGFFWQEAGVDVSISPSSQARALARSLELVPASGFPRLRLTELPAGMEVLGQWNPSRRALPSLRASDAAAVAPLWVDLSTTEYLYLTNRWTFTGVDVNGVDGLVFTGDSGESRVIWPLSDGLWADLAITGLSADRAVEIADEVRFTDDTGWRDRYQVVATTASTAPAIVSTTASIPATPALPGADGDPRSTTTGG